MPIFISDGEPPVQTSTSTLTIRVCSCDGEGNVMSCNAEAYSLPASLSRGALIAILACIFVLLGELRPVKRGFCHIRIRSFKHSADKNTNNEHHKFLYKWQRTLNTLFQINKITLKKTEWANPTKSKTEMLANIGYCS